MKSQVKSQLKSPLKSLMLGTTLLFSLGLLGLSRAEAQDCASQFLDMRFREQNAQVAQATWGSKSGTDRIAASFVMIGDSGLPKFNVKEWEREGKLTLGIKSSGGETLIAVYKIDGSIDDSSPRLIQLKTRGSGATKILISDDPIDVTTGRLRPEVETNPLVTAVRAKLPLQLGVEMTDFLRENVHLLDYAEAKDFRLLSEGGSAASNLRNLKIRLKGRWIKEVIARDIVKQVFRALVFGGVVFGSSLLAVATADREQSDQKTVSDALAALMLVEMANMEAEAGVRVPDSERTQLVLNISQHVKAEKSKPEARPNVAGEILKLTDIQIGSTIKSRGDHGPEKFWVLDRKSNRIFVGIAERVFDVTVRGTDSGAQVELNTKALIEIRADQMPVTYRIAEKIYFKNVETKK